MDVDNKDYAVCNHCECEKINSCKRYNPSILASYNFAEICHNEWFMQKEKNES